MTGSKQKMASLKLDGLIAPQGWGSRGTEGIIRAIRYTREEKLPYLGLCFGMQLASVEFARNVCGLKGANSTEIDPKTPYPVIHIMPDQKEYLAKSQYGGTIRLGEWPAVLKKGSRIEACYKKHLKGFVSGSEIRERHRHRYEFNNEYRETLEKCGFVLSAVSPDGKLVEAVELPKEAHPFFIGTQFHPELASKILSPQPLFVEFVKACL
jgi:CTP synthase